MKALGPKDLDGPFDELGPAQALTLFRQHTAVATLVRGGRIGQAGVHGKTYIDTLYCQLIF